MLLKLQQKSGITMTQAEKIKHQPATTVDIKTSDQQTFVAQLWDHHNPIATIHIVHGMAEHCLRYQPLAEQLQQAGYRVVSHNHRGHGDRLPQGHYADSRGWELVIDDMLQVQQQLCSDSAVILLGHSMGSFIAQGFAIRYGDRLSGLILSGSNYQSAFMYKAGRTVARVLKLFQGGRTQSKVMDRLSFGAFNNRFKPARTEFDWLSRDNQQVDRYIQDPACGHTCTLQLWIDLFGGLIEISQPGNLAHIPADLPIWLFAGECDPVGQNGKGVNALQQALTDSGHKNVSCTLYADARHEMLNELNAAEVRQEILNRINDMIR
ncbi:alpha/beta fold hydrolase [Bacterioplanoides pacificum]|uniref:Alpha/beta fold hydrolase n=1 Tax=Bacterioplanoides pacificum TaxID=1171596 RepID=A0ABV7VR50_9GAMM